MNRLDIFRDDKEINLSRSNLAAILGMRQINQLSQFPDYRLKIVSSVLSFMSEESKEKQIQKGKSFSFDFTPGCIGSKKDFDSYVSKSRMSDKLVPYCEKVLVDGVSLNELDIDSATKQSLEQACISINRIHCNKAKERIIEVKNTFKRFDKILKGKKHGSDYVFAALTGVSVAMASTYRFLDETKADELDSSVIPNFTLTAYSSLLNHLPEDLVISISELITDISNKLSFFDNNFWIEGCSALKGKVDALSLLPSIKAGTILDKNKNSVFPNIFKLMDYSASIDSLLTLLKKIDGFVFRTEDGKHIGSFLKIKEMIGNGHSLFSISKSYAEMFDKEQTALYHKYNRKLKKESQGV